MIELSNLDSYLREFLDTVSFKDHCVNGIQVDGKEKIERIVTGVTISERLIREAIDFKADTILVHHGLFWKFSQHPFTLTGIQYKRVKLLVENNISLFGIHLPLDAHPEIGNNALIAGNLGLQDIEFLELTGMQNPISAVGNLPVPLEFDQFVNHANRMLETDGIAFNFNDAKVNRVYAVSGGAAGYYMDAVNAGSDIMITGELKEDVIRSAEECGLSLYAAGHYNSEKWGVRALGEHLMNKYDIEVKFIDIPNPV